MDNEMTEEMIQLEMQQTRESLAAKLETLEEKVVGTVENATMAMHETVENATMAVNETVDAIKETVHETVATVQEGVKGSVDSVKDFLDVPAHVERNPWLMLSGSVAVGYGLGMMLAPRDESKVVSASTGTSFQPRAEYTPALSVREPPSMWQSEVDKLKGLALGVLFGTARELLVSALPTHMADQLKDVVDSVTTKMGGKPIPSSDWANLSESVTPTEPVTSQGAGEAEEGRRPIQEAGAGHSPTRRW